MENENIFQHVNKELTLDQYRNLTIKRMYTLKGRDILPIYQVFFKK